MGYWFLFAGDVLPWDISFSWDLLLGEAGKNLNQFWHLKMIRRDTQNSRLWQNVMVIFHDFPIFDGDHMLISHVFFPELSHHVRCWNRLRLIHRALRMAHLSCQVPIGPLAQHTRFDGGRDAVSEVTSTIHIGWCPESLGVPLIIIHFN